MSWVLIFWIFTGNGYTVSTADFNTRTACAKAALGLSQQFGRDFGFQCVEKGRVK